MTLPDPRELPEAEQLRIARACQTFCAMCVKGKTPIRFRVNVEHHDPEKGRVRDWMTQTGIYEGLEAGHVLRLRQTVDGRSHVFHYDVTSIDPGSLEQLALATQVREVEEQKKEWIAGSWR